MKYNNEYEIFKAICQSKLINVDEINAPLLENLKQKGLQLSNTGQYYLLEDEIDVLSETKIRACLDFQTNELINPLDVIFQTPSTNTTIARYNPSDSYAVLVAEYQSDGQGRRAKQWISPLGSNICLSIQFQLAKANNTQFIPLITALSICQALTRLGISGCRIKWPNDIYLNGRKLAGILVESRYNPDKYQIFVVGIGLNVNMQINNKIDQLWTSLRNTQNKVFNRNSVLSALLSEIVSNFNQFGGLNFQQFKEDWDALDYLYGRKIIVTEEQSCYEAVALGIANDGALQIERSEQGKKIHYKIYSAEVSVKTNNAKEGFA